MIMTDSEIAADYRQAKNRPKQLGILAELNGCKKSDIVKILVDAGETVPRNYAAYEKTTAGTEAEAADGGILRSAQNDSKKALDEAKAEVNSAKAEVEIVKTEVERLKKQLAMSGAELVTFKLRFAAWQAAWAAMREALAQVPEEQRGGCEAAVKAQIEGWAVAAAPEAPRNDGEEAV